jgi:lysophospholipase L1-like esterase
MVALTKTKPPRIIFLGNSITHFWGGQPEPPLNWGSDSWSNVFIPLGTQNLGYGWDRIENVLWRVYHGELDGYAANQVIVMIGTNNLEFNSNAEIVEGLKWLVQAIRVRQSKAAILLLGILPRRQQEQRIAQLNDGIAQASGELNVSYLDAGGVFLNSEGKIDESLFSDGLHPNAEGYRKLASTLQPYLSPGKQSLQSKK